MSEKICNSCGNHKENENSFAKDLLSSYKKTTSSVIKIAIISNIIWALLCAGTITGFLVYLNQYDYSAYEITTDDGGDALYQKGDYSSFTNNNKE